MPPLGHKLLASWPMNGDALDISRRGNDLTNAGAVSFVAGKIKQAASFSGLSTQGLHRAGSGDFSSATTPSWTIAVWFKVNTLGSTAVIASKYLTTGNQKAWRLLKNGADSVTFQVSFDGLNTTNIAYSGLDPISSGVWYLVVAWVDVAGQVIGIHLFSETTDYGAETTPFVTSVFDSTARFVIGAADGATFQNPINGLVDAPAFWGKVLSGADRLTLWATGAGVEVQPMTGSILLWPGALTLPDGSAGNAFAGSQVLQSTGAAPANAPKVHFDELLFDPATDEHVLFGFRLPPDYVSGGTVKIQFHANEANAANSVVWKACVAAVTPDVAELTTTKSYPAPDTVTKSITATANELREASIALSATALNGLAAGDWVSLMVGRDGDNVSDTCTVDAAVDAVNFEYIA